MLVRPPVNRSALLTALGCLGLSVVLFFYSRSEPEHISDYRVVSLHPESAFYEPAPRKDHIVVVSKDTSYYLKGHLWRGKYDPDSLVASLSTTDTVLVWVDRCDCRGFYVHGMEADSIRISPTVGADWKNENRRGWRWGALVLLVIGLGALAVAVFDNATDDR